VAKLEKEQNHEAHQEKPSVAFSSDIIDALAASTLTTLEAAIVVRSEQSAVCVVSHTPKPSAWSSSQDADWLCTGLPDTKALLEVRMDCSCDMGSHNSLVTCDITRISCKRDLGSSENVSSTPNYIKLTLKQNQTKTSDI